MSKILDFLSYFISITGNTTIDGIILFIIGVLSFLVAFGIVGIIFDAIGFYDSDAMSGTHWVIRIIVFLILSAVLIALAKLITWLLSFHWWVYLILFVVLSTLILIFYFLKSKKSKKRVPHSIFESDISPAPFPVRSINAREHCPRCGGYLVKRQGPYGVFYGCENYPSQNCKYTRKFK